MIDFELQLFEDVRAKHSRAIGEFREDETYINLEYAKHIIPTDWEDDSFQPTAPPTAYEAVENATNHVLTFPITSVPIRPVTKDKEAAKITAEQSKQFHDMWWHRVFEDYGNPVRRVTKSLIKGKGALKVEVKWDLLPDPDGISKAKFRSMVERVGKYRFLWDVKVVAKETVYEVGDPWNPDGVFEHYQITGHEARKKWPNSEGLQAEVKDLGPMDKVEYLEYWSKPNGTDPGKFIQWVGGKRVHEAENPYSWETPMSTDKKADYDGFVPYVIGDPGWGDTDEEDNPEDRYVSIIRPIRSVAIAEARYLTELDMWLRWYVFPMIKAVNIKEGENEPELGPGNMVFLNQSDPSNMQDISVMPMGEAPVTLLQGLARVNQYIDTSTKFSTLGGVAQRGVDTATEADMNVRNAQAKLAGLVSSLSRMCSVVNRMVRQTIENVLEVPVTLYGASDHGPSEITIKPRDISGFYFTKVELGTSDDAALHLRNARTWADLTSVLPISFRTAMEKAGITNPTNEFDERMLENLEQSPQAMQVLLLAMLSAQQDANAALVQAGFQNQIMSGGGEPGVVETSRPDFLPGEGNINATARDQAMAAAPEREMF